MRQRFVNKDRKSRTALANTESKRLALRYIVGSDLFSESARKLAQQRLHRLSRGNGKLTRLTNYCVLSGRSRSVYKDFRLSRIKFREMALSGNIYGVTKSSW